MIRFKAYYRPCPFCGSNKTDVSRTLSGYEWGVKDYEVNCENCQASGPVRKTKQEAIDAWNERVDPMRYKNPTWEV